MQTTIHPIRRTYELTCIQPDTAHRIYQGIREKLAQLAHPNEHLFGAPENAASYLFSKAQPRCRVDVQLVDEPPRVSLVVEYLTLPRTLEPLENLVNEFGLQQTGANHIKSTPSGRTGVRPSTSISTLRTPIQK